MRLWDEVLRDTERVDSPADSKKLRELKSALKASTFESAKTRSRPLKRQGYLQFEKIMERRCQWFSEQVAISFLCWFDQEMRNDSKLRRMKKAAETILGIKDGFTSFSIDENLTITKGDKHYDCPENWVGIVDDTWKKITNCISILENEPPEGEHDGGIGVAESDPSVSSDDEEDESSFFSHSSLFTLSDSSYDLGDDGAEETNEVI